MPFNAVLAFLGSAFNSLKNRYYKRGYDAAVSDPNEALADCRKGMVHFTLHDMWLLGETKSAGELQAIMEMTRSPIPSVMGISNLPAPARLGSQGQIDTFADILRRLPKPKKVNIGIPHKDWFVQKMIPLVEQENAHILAVIDAVSMCVLTGRTDLAIQGLFGAGKSRAVAMSSWPYLGRPLLALCWPILALSWPIWGPSWLVALCQQQQEAQHDDNNNNYSKNSNNNNSNTNHNNREAQNAASTYFDIRHSAKTDRLPKCRLLVMTGGSFANDRCSTFPALDTFLSKLMITISSEKIEK